MRFDQRFSCFNQTIPSVAETHPAMNVKNIWNSERGSRECISRLGKERYCWFVKSLNLMILPRPRAFHASLRYLRQSQKTFPPIPKHIVPKRGFDSILSSPIHSLTTQTKFQLTISAPDGLSRPSLASEVSVHGRQVSHRLGSSLSF